MIQNCPIHGSQGKCICTSFITDGKFKNQDSFEQNINNVEPKIYENYSNNNENAEKIKPFTNNPPLPFTQRY